MEPGSITGLVASAALNVNVGNFSDEIDMPGMADTVKHLLFMGTKKFPVENEYSQYLLSNSGSSNAYTASTSTNYYFELAVKLADDRDPAEENPLLRAVLDRFSQFFIEPLFLSSTLDRELRAVDSENKKNLQNDIRPDRGTEDDFKVEDTPFAFSPGQLNKLLNPKSLSAFWKLGGLRGIERAFQTVLPINITVCPTARSFLPVVIGRATFDALPDTNAPCNVMTEVMAFRLGVRIDRDPQKQRTFRNALGQYSRSIGMTNIELSFPDKKWEKWACDFAVVRHCAESLVIGDPFLQLTSTMDKFRHRLKRVVASTAVSARKALRLMHLATPRRKMSCYVDGEHTFSNVDSGADADFASLEYALFHGWDIQPLSDDEGFVMLADRQVVKVAGYVDTDLRIRGDARQKRFYILDGLVCDVLLGDDTIDDMNVFNKYKDSFLDLDLGLDVDIDFGSTTDSDDFCVIRWADFYDETTYHVNQLLGTAPVVGSSGQSGIGKFVGRMKSGMRRGPSLSDQDVVLELMRKLEAVDVMERRFQREATKLLSTLTGDELDEVKQRDSERKTKHQATRQKIIDLIQDYQH